MRPGTVTRVKTPSSRHVLLLFVHLRHAPLDDCLSQHLASELSALPLRDHAARTSNRQSAACRPIAAVAAAAGSRPWASSVRLSPHYSLPVLVKIPPGILENVRLSRSYLQYLHVQSSGKLVTRCTQILHQFGTGYGHKSHDTQFQTRSLLVIPDKCCLTNDFLPDLLTTLRRLENAARMSNLQSAAGCRTIVAVAAATGSRLSASSVRLSPFTVSAIPARFIRPAFLMQSLWDVVYCRLTSDQSVANANCEVVCV